LVVGVVQSPEEVVNCPHLQARGSFVEYDHPDVGALNYPGAGFLVDGANPLTAGHAAPGLGEHNAAIYSGELGCSVAELAHLRAAGVI
jgi:formyl-CoA transferase